jgi:hypothetical protein
MMPDKPDKPDKPQTPQTPDDPKKAEPVGVDTSNLEEKRNDPPSAGQPRSQRLTASRVARVYEDRFTARSSPPSRPQV